eukprot:690639-Rhodomonas_salina.1
MADQRDSYPTSSSPPAVGAVNETPDLFHRSLSTRRRLSCCKFSLQITRSSPRVLYLVSGRAFYAANDVSTAQKNQRNKEKKTSRMLAAASIPRAAAAHRPETNN